jgi:hypothetical protein
MYFDLRGFKSPERRVKETLLLFVFLGGRVQVQLLHCADCRLCKAQLYAVTAGFENERIVFDGDNAADNAADRRHLIADLEIVAHFRIALFLLLLGAIDHKVEQNDHQAKRKGKADIAFRSSGQELHGNISSQFQIFYIIIAYAASFKVNFGKTVKGRMVLAAFCGAAQAFGCIATVSYLRANGKRGRM